MLKTITDTDGYDNCADECGNSAYGYLSNALSGCRWACEFITREKKTLSECNASCLSREENGLYHGYERDACEDTCSRIGMKFKLYVVN